MYKNFNDLEEHLTRQELGIMIEKAREKKHDDQRFMAALKGIDLDKGKESDFDKIKARAEAKALGVSEEQYELAGHFNITEEDE